MADVVDLSIVRAARPDNSGVSPTDACARCIAEIATGEITPTSALVLHLDRSDGAYDFGWFASNLALSEIVALAEAVKVIALDRMLSD